ncbi:MAG TPA: outer membrane beta-barrel protein [Burkholderiales bacterium]|nr:outer membrane beta-barrel protein [Burkholderiales bacterium]
MRPSKKKIALAVGIAFSVFNTSYADQPNSAPVQSQQGGNTGGQLQEKLPKKILIQPLPLPVPPYAQARPEQDTGEIRWGTFKVSPGISVSELFDSNIYATPNNEVQDWVTIVSPSISIKSAWTKHMLNFSAGADIDQYANYSAEDTADNWANIDSRYDFSSNANIYAGIGISRNHEDRSTPDAVLNSKYPTFFTETQGYVGAYRKFKKIAVRLGSTYQKLDFSNGITDTGLEINNNVRNRNLTSLGGRISYSITPTYDLFAQGTTDIRQYQMYFDNYGYHRDSNGYRAAIGGGINFSKRLNGEVYVGHLLQNYKDSRFQDVNAPYFGGEIKWFKTPQTTISGFIDRSVEETTLTGSSSSLDTTIGGRVEHWIQPRLKLNMHLGYTRSVFQGYDITDSAFRVDKLLDAGIGLRYDLNRYIYLGGDYQFLRRESNVLDGNYYRNQVMITIGSQFLPLKSLNTANSTQVVSPHSYRSDGAYVGIQTGYGSTSTALFGQRGSNGTLAADFGNKGIVNGIFAGYGINFNPWYLGIELNGNVSNLNWNHNHLPNQRIFNVEQQNSYGISGRLGYVLDSGMIYGRVGLAQTDFYTTYTLDNGVTFTQNNGQYGRRYGFGTEAWAGGNAFWRLDYTYTTYDNYDVNYLTGVDSFHNRETLFQLGFGWHLGAHENHPPKAQEIHYSGFYMGLQAGQDMLNTYVNAFHGEDNSTLLANYGASGINSGVFGGYGHAWHQVYLGFEINAEASNAIWQQNRVTSGSGGRDYSVRERGGYGGALRLGYVMNEGSLLYFHYGLESSTFETNYNRGPNYPYDENNRLRGKRFGVGVELPLGSNLFWRMEYDYTHYPDLNFKTAQPGNPDIVNISNSDNLYRIGLLYRF